MKTEVYDIVRKIFDVPPEYGVQLFACTTLGELDAVNERFVAQMKLKKAS